MKLIVGLGNIGKEFENTNHNMGFMVVDAVAREIGASFKKNTCSSLVAEGNYHGEKYVLAKPTTFMNLSGIAVKSLVKKYKVDSKKELVVVSDDIDLHRGNVRMRTEGSAGTHNGLRNVVETMNTTEFCRLRIGIEKPGENIDLADYVLSNCHLDETLMKGIERGKEACLMFLSGESFSQIMQKVN